MKIESASITMRGLSEEQVEIIKKHVAEKMPTMKMHSWPDKKETYKVQLRTPDHGNKTTLANMTELFTKINEK